MKKITLVVTLLFIFSQIGFAQLSCLVLDVPMSGNAGDSSGNNYHGKVYGATLASDRFNNSSSAYYFDGKDDYIEFIDPKALNKKTDQISISVWYKPEKGNFYNTLIAHNGFHFIVQLMDSDLEPAFAIQKLKFDYKGAKKKQERLTLNQKTSTSKWTHMVCTFDSAANNISVYIDGKLTYSGLAKGTLRKDNKNWRIGARESSGFPEYFKGYIDDVMVFDCAIDSNEVTTLFQGKIKESSCKAEIKYSFDTQNPCQVAFNTDTSVFANTAKFNWDFGDNATDTGKNITHVYQKSGTFKVALIITDSLKNCTSSTSVIVNVKKCNLDTTTNCLVLNMPFTGNASDSSGNSYNGNVYGATLSEDRFGNPNSAYYFDGRNDYIEIENPSKLNQVTSQISISAWVKPESGNFYNTIMCHSNAHLVMQLMDKNFEPAFLIQKLNFNSTGAKIKYGRLTLNNSIDTNKWTHLVCVYDSFQSTFNVYINGQIVFSGFTTGGLRKDNPEWRIGARNSTNFEEYFKGYIDDIKVYRCAIGSNTVKKLFLENAPKPKCTAYFNYKKVNGFNCLYELKSQSDDTTSNTKYVWQIGDSIIYGGSNTKYQFAKSGKYNIELVISDSSTGCKSSIEKTIDAKRCKQDFPDTSNCLAVDIDFNYEFKDKSENGYLVRNYGSVFSKGHLGNDSFGIQLKGNDYVEITNPEKLNSSTNALSVSMWFNASQSNNYNTLISHASANFFIQLIGDDLQPAFLGQSLKFNYNGATEYKERLMLNTTLDKNRWYHIACTYDSINTEFVVYLNGKEIYNGFAEGTLRNTDSTWRIGSRVSNGFPEYFTGLVDEVKLFKCVIDSNQVKQLYDFSTSHKKVNYPKYSIYPNPNVGSFILTSTENASSQFNIYNSLGQEINTYKKSFLDNNTIQIDFPYNANGIFYLNIKDGKSFIKTHKILIQRP